jgi:adenine-specific DNA-methyltransferase
MSEIEKLPLTSLDIIAHQLERLKAVFPEAFTEGNKVDWDKLRLTIGEAVDTGKERYGMNWPGKADCFKTIQQPSIATLVPAREESVDFDTTQNLFIEGDNLEVLKLLQKSYLGKVKMIYIDPPYNTGNDFIYPDNYSESLDTYLAYTEQVDAEGRKFSTNTETDGRFHSKWMNMMYPRLFLAKNLLRDDGVIFISIDDNEVQNLRIICNEIFGEENFVAKLVWRRRVSSALSDNNVSLDHEYVMVFQKGLLKKFEGNKKDYSNYSNPDNDHRGPWIADNLTVGMTASMRPNQAYDLIDPKTGKIYPFNPNRVWAFIPESMNRMISEGRIIFPESTNKRPMQKRFQSELKSDRNPFSSMMTDQVGLNTEATRLLQELFNGNIFDYSKPLTLLRILAFQITANDDLILDFFAGSATTAHAVLDLNKEDGGNRRFICVQLPEPTDENSEAHKAGYQNIADIGKERIRRVIAKIRQERKDNQNLFSEGQPAQDLGFKVFKLKKSNFRIWNAGVEKTPEAIQQQLLFHVDHISPEAEQEAILFELLLKSGFELTTPIEPLQIEGKRVYSIAAGELLICLDKQLTHEVIKAMAERGPARVICLDEGFQDNDQLKTNAVQIMKSKGVVNFRTV